MLSLLSLALKMTQRDWRAGQLRFLLVSLIVAVTALSAVGFFVDRMRTGLTRDANQLLGADMVVRTDLPIQAAWVEEAKRRGLNMAETVTFPSMSQAGDGEQSVSQLSSIKAVSDGYPLRGNLRISTDVAQAVAMAGATTEDIPAPGTVWVDAAILTSLKTQVGGTLKLGDAQFKIAQLIAAEPDRGTSFLNFSPRVMLPLANLESTGLIQFGSRVSYRLLLAAPSNEARSDVASYKLWLEEQIKAANIKGVEIESLESGRPEMSATLERAERFLSLVGLLSAMLAAVAVAMAARRFMLAHMDACAMLRCLGLTQNQATAMYLIEFVIVGLVGSAIGVILGFTGHLVLLQLLGSLVQNDLPPVSWMPALQGVAIGMVLLVGFALPPILQLRNVPYNRVIRGEQDGPKAMVLATYGFGICTFVGLLLWQAGAVQLALLTAGGFLSALAVFAFVGWLGLKSLKIMRGAIDHQGWRFAVTSLQRRPGATLIQIVSLALGLMALLLLTVVRGDLMTAWREATPENAPNRFIINIMPEQKEAIAARLAQAGVVEAPLYPMIRGRLTAVNDNPITATTYTDERAIRLSEREFNLSTMSQMQSTNELIEGAWFEDMPGAPAEASVEEGIAKTLGLKLGDMVRFNIAGTNVDARVTSLRKLEWGSMQVNFFVIINPQAMLKTPQTWITAFNLPQAQASLGNALTRDYPNLTVVDIGGLIRQIEAVLNQVILAVQFLFMFTLASGGLVLYAALMGSQDERTREAGLLRALGATRKQLSQAQLIEFTLVGALAGLLAATGAAAMGWALATYQFKFEWSFEPTVWLAGLVVGALCAIAGGWLGLRGVLTRPPLETLRNG